MGTLVCFHAHPDDEAIGTGGLIARAAAGLAPVLLTPHDGEFTRLAGPVGPDRVVAARGLAEKPAVHKQSKKDKPRAKAQERLKAAEEAAKAAAEAPANA